MTDADRFKLLFGPYHPTHLRNGDGVFCELRGQVVVRGMSAGRIPWPTTTWPHRRGAPVLIVCAGLAEALRREFGIAVCHWWNLSPGTVSKYR
jgi:hypothetical protein